MIRNLFNATRIKTLVTLSLVLGLTFAVQAQRIAYVDVNLILESLDEYKDCSGRTRPAGGYVAAKYCPGIR